MTIMMFWWRTLCLAITLITLFVSSVECADLVSRCPPQLSRTRYLKAAEWGTCYEFHSEERTWSRANSICKNKGGHLVTIKEERIQKFILKALTDFNWPRNGLWIGATDQENEMEWVWVTGERVKDGYSKWATGQPSCGFLCFEDCALMRWKEGGGKWHDYRCNWFEDYSFICEYDMLPETTTMTTTTTALPSTASTTTTVITETPLNTVIVLKSSAEALGSDYLLHNQKIATEEKSYLGNEVKNDSDRIPPPADFRHGVEAARAEQVHEKTSSSGLGSGALAVTVVTVVVSLAVGLCFLFIFMRRRRSKHFREDDTGISYQNPYYEDAKTSLTGKGGNSRYEDNDADGKTDVNYNTGGSQAVGFTSTALLKNNAETQRQQLDSPAKRLMNNYDVPPVLAANLPLYKNKRTDRRIQPAKNTESGKEDNSCPADMENHYDEIQSKRPDSKVMYDVPRASRCQSLKAENNYNNDDHDPEFDQMYYNSCNENIYESVDNLQTMVEQLQQRQNEDMYDPKVKEEEDNRYVPFMLDAPEYS